MVNVRESYVGSLYFDDTGFIFIDKIQNVG